MMPRRYGKELTAKVQAIGQNPKSALGMSQSEYAALCERVHKTPALYNQLPVVCIDGWTGDRVDIKTR
jgi:hypothetical protein